MAENESDKLENTTETICTQEPPVAETRRPACLVHIYPSGPCLGRRYPLTGDALVIGRGSDCEVRVEDHSVSRRHVSLQPTGDGYLAIDLESTNGTFIHGEKISRQELRDGDYLRVGSCIYRFLAGGNVESEYHEEIHRLAIIDALTEIPNKRRLMEFLEHELTRAARHKRPLSLIVFDIDHFKSVNDQHGHLCGDFVLRELAALVKEVVRRDELFARYGGEEFAVVLPESNLEQALSVAERIRALVERHSFRFDDVTPAVTVSLGAASVGDVSLSATELIGRADEKLYQAKRVGRNRVAS